MSFSYSFALFTLRREPLNLPYFDFHVDALTHLALYYDISFACQGEVNSFYANENAPLFFNTRGVLINSRDGAVRDESA